MTEVQARTLIQQGEAAADLLRSINTKLAAIAVVLERAFPPRREPMDNEQLYSAIFGAPLR